MDYNGDYFFFTTTKSMQKKQNKKPISIEKQLKFNLIDLIYRVTQKW
jgi:hypothetical protein